MARVEHAMDTAEVPLISVILCTAGLRPTMLRACVDSLRAIRDPRFEIVIVDNGREPTVAADELVAAGCRVVHEPRRGLDCARNRGVAEAAGEIVAFIDDDCEAHPGWLTGVRASFGPSIDCVTGRVVAASTLRPSERWFEARFSFDRGPDPRLFRAGDIGVPYCPWQLGTGCNMAFRRRVFDAIGGFDERLDMGTLIGGAGDLDLFARLLAAGREASYAPDAVVHHHHRSTVAALRRQSIGYGATVSALATLAFLRWPHWRRPVARAAVDEFRERARRVVRRDARPVGVPASLAACELLGFLWGPVALALSSARRRGGR